MTSGKICAIDRIDPYMAIPETDESGITFHSPFESPFRLAGSAFQKQMFHRFRRIPFEPFVSDRVDTLAWNTSGLQLQFKSDSKRVVVKAKLSSGNLMNHMPQTGSSGFDLYVGGPGSWRLIQASRYELHATDFTAELFTRKEPGMREFLINFPLYNGVEELWIGLEENCTILPPSPWSCDKPAVVYGTSITQGGCASHPGGSWTNILSRRHNAEFYNFGFSGNAKGEPAIAEILASIPEPRCFILDYEANAGNAGMKNTLKNFLDILRSKYPEVPIMLISLAPFSRAMVAFGAGDDGDLVCPSNRESRDFQRAEVERRQAAGDRNIQFVNGMELLGTDWDECMMDGRHFNDLGFYRFAENLNKYINF